jgi:hypothetical protein
MPLRRNRPVAWIAAFAVVLQALWPLLAHARPGESRLLAPVCAVGGSTHYIDLNSGKAPPEERGALFGNHCKLCTVGFDRIAALPAEPAVLLAVVKPAVEQAIAQPVPLPEPLNHPPAQPRAPPEIS